VIFPGEPGNLITDWPEGYDASRWGTSGNISINGTLTYGGLGLNEHVTPLFMQSVGQPERDVNDPPYAIHHGDGSLATKTVAPNATHENGLVELDVHNIFGYMEERATYLALLKQKPTERPFIISRSTFPSSGHWTGHWVRQHANNSTAC